MKKVLKLIFSVALLLSLAIVMTACGNNDEPTPATPPAAETTPPPAGVDPAPAPISDMRVALVAHSPESILNDGSFNQGAHDGIVRFLASQGLPAGNVTFYQAVAADNDARLNVMIQAIDGGADVLVLPGFQFAYALYGAQDLFPDTYFIILDSEPERNFTSRIENNVAAINYAEHESGFLAGYAAVQDGFRSLGFMGGMAIPPVQRFGHGFIQGAEHAAQQLGLSAGDVTIEFIYHGAFAPDPSHVVMASAWYELSGVEVIFVAAGGIGFAVFEAAEASGGLAIGVDSDQSGDSDTVITSAMKMLDSSVYDMLTDIANNRFRGGQLHVFDAALGGVALPMNTSRFNSFTQAQYDAIFNAIVSGAVNVSSSTDQDAILANVSLVTVNDLN